MWLKKIPKFVWDLKFYHAECKRHSWKENPVKSKQGKSTLLRSCQHLPRGSQTKVVASCLQCLALSILILTFSAVLALGCCCPFDPSAFLLSPLLLPYCTFWKFKLSVMYIYQITNIEPFAFFFILKKQTAMVKLSVKFNDHPSQSWI